MHVLVPECVFLCVVRVRGELKCVFFLLVCVRAVGYSRLWPEVELILAGSPTLWSFKGRCYYPDLAIKAGDWMPHW